MRKAIFAAVFMGVCTSTTLANDRDLALYLTGNTSISLTKDQQRHYVAGMMDAWLVDAFVSDGERFGYESAVMPRSIRIHRTALVRVLPWQTFFTRLYVKYTPNASLTTTAMSYRNGFVPFPTFGGWI